MKDEDLRRLVASPGWEWMEGCVYSDADCGHRYHGVVGWKPETFQGVDPLPLDRAATRGCMLRMVRNWLNDPFARVRWSTSRAGYHLVTYTGWQRKIDSLVFDTEFEALAHVLMNHEGA